MAELLLGLAIAAGVALLLWRRSSAGVRRGRVAPRQLQQELIRQLSGDRQAAERLVEREKRLNPGHPESWYWEKALNDLRRDRR